MGTVYAKSIDTEEDKYGSDIISGLKVQVQRVHVNGLSRTEEDIVINSVKDVFKGRNAKTVVLKIHEAIMRLEGLGCFKGVNALMETYEGQDAVHEGIQVTFNVKEVNVVGARVNTAFGHNEGSMSTAAVLRNLFGRGEELNSSFSYGSKKQTGMTINFVKPFHDAGLSKLTSRIYQSHTEAGWSGYKELDRGLLVELALKPAYNMRSQLILDAAWRHLSCLSKSTAFAVREHCGPSLKTSVRHESTRDTRDNDIFPTDGHMIRVKNELAGLCGNISFLKNELAVQANVPLLYDIVAQASVSCGHILPLNSSKSTSIMDRFLLGGPMGLRGFQIGGAGPHTDGYALGAEMFWEAGVHVFSPMPLLPRGSFTDRFRLHLWATTGNIGDWPLAGDGSVQSKVALLTKDMRLSYGAGIALSLAGLARVELNYCVPFLHKRGDKLAPGVQFGIAADFL